MHARLVELVAGLVGGPAPLVESVHDVSDGGLAVALAEMAVHGAVGFEISGPIDHVDLFGEAPSRVLVALRPPAVAEVRRRASQAGVGLRLLGRSGGSKLVVEGLVDLPLDLATTAWRHRIPHDLEVDGVRGVPEV